MSRGPGRVMRAALEVVLSCDEAVSADEIAVAVYGIQPEGDGRLLVTQAQQTSVRRAMADSS